MSRRPFTPPCYGSKRSRKRARELLTAQEIKPGVWLVTGGEIGHGVTVEDNVYHCDCDKQELARDQMCSHCLTVFLLLNGHFEKP